MEFHLLGGGLMLVAAACAVASSVVVKQATYQRHLAVAAVAVGLVGAVVTVI